MKRLSFIACLILVVSGALVFVIRGVGHGVRRNEPNDFWSSYTVPRAWALGEAPFDSQNLAAIWNEQSKSPTDSFTRYVIRNYFVLPPAIPFLAPLSVFSWRIANAVWVIGSSLCFLTMVWVIRPRREVTPLALLFVGLCLWSDPVRIGLAISNVTPMLIALLGFSYVFWLRKRIVHAGILLGIVGCFKPQFAIPAGLFFIAVHEWKAVYSALATVVAGFAVFLARVQISGAGWRSEFLERSKGFGTPGGPNDWSLLNPERYNLLNLQVPIGGFVHNAALVNILSMSLIGVLVLAWFLATKRTGEPGILQFAAINVLMLLPAYHRTYDAAVLTFVLAWALSSATGSEKSRLLVVGLSLVFIQPIPTTLIVLTSKPWMITAANNSLLLRSFVLPYEVWTLFAMAIVLTFAVLSASNRATGEPEVGGLGVRGAGQ